MSGSSPGEPMSSQATVGGTSRSTSQPAAASASATTTTGPSSQAGVAIDSSQPSRRCPRRSSLFPLSSGGSLRVSRADCIRLVVFGVFLAGIVMVVPVGGQEPASLLTPINELRNDDELAPVVGSAELDALAERYLAAILESRCLCPVVDGAASAQHLVVEVRAALGSEAVVVDAGLVVGYDRSRDAAIRTAAFDPSNGAVILGSRMTLAGIATGVVEAAEGWLVPPPGGVGPEIDLSGYTLVVILMAGSSE